jgi:predicted dehydrogenase
MSEQPIRVGIVGLSAGGGWAARAHVPALQTIVGFELTALTASSSRSAAEAGAAYGVSATYDSAESMARDAAVDLVVITVKVPEHRALISAAIGAGKAVLCEWPLALDLAEAETLAQEADDRGVASFVGLQARSAPAVRYVHDLVDAGRIGKVLSTTLVGLGGTWGAETRGRDAYNARKENGATLLSIPFGHTLDAVQMVLGEFSWVEALVANRRRETRNVDTGEMVALTAPDEVLVIGELAGGCPISVHYRGGRPPGAVGLLWEIVGTNGVIVVRAGAGHMQLADLTVEASLDGASETSVLTVPVEYYADPRLVGLPATVTNVANQYAGIRSDLTVATSTVPTFERGVQMHRLLDAIERSNREHARALPAAG